MRQNSGEPINPEVALCAKGSYHIDESLLRARIYPLAFPLAVLYLRDNRDLPRYKIGNKFAELLLSDEGQHLLRATNLVPVHPVREQANGDR